MLAASPPPANVDCPFSGFTYLHVFKHSEQRACYVRWWQRGGIRLHLICLVYYSPRTSGELADTQGSGSLNDGYAVILDNVARFAESTG